MSTKVKTKDYELIDGSVRTLVQQVGDGSIIKRFEKTALPINSTDIVCPHFLELKWATGCPFNCAWCYLNGTLRFQPQKKKPYLKDFLKIRSHADAFLNEVLWCNEVLNTGELADSLMWENNGTSFSKFIISVFKNQTKHKLLFLSKSNAIQGILDVDGRDSVILSFSLNAELIAETWEMGAPSVLERIEAAKKTKDAGYEVRVRIDPMVPVNNWIGHYKELIDKLFESFVPDRITLGSLRGLQSTINNSSDKTWTKYLFEVTRWGKKVEFATRYLMYSEILSYLKDQYRYKNVAVCKETKSIWENLGLNYREIKCNCTL
ncbi:MAG: hypothetical protein M1371_01025 [Actinobacteria bacterium]|nr:hypothetical protein [Actinomycetota bacterium]